MYVIVERIVTLGTKVTAITTAKVNTHSEYVLLIAFPLHQWLKESASILHFTYIACLVL